MKSNLYLALICLSTTLIFSCQTMNMPNFTPNPACRGTKVSVRPKINFPSPVAVLEFQGPEPYSHELTGKMEATLTNAQWQDKNLYEVVDRNNINKVTKELQRSNSSWLFNPRTVARAGKRMGAKTVIVGKVTRAKVEDTLYTDKKKVCTKWKKDTEKWKQMLGLGCEQEQIHYIPCVKRKGYFSFTYKVIDVETSKVLYAQTIDDHSGESKQCNPTRPMKNDVSTGDDTTDIVKGLLNSGSLDNLQDETEAVKEAMEEAVAAIESDLSVRYICAAVKKKSSVTGASKALAAGAKFITKNAQLWDKARPIWEAGYQKYPAVYELAYNLGLCAEVNGNLKEASYYYQEAYDNMSCVDQDIVAARERVKGNMGS
jgi:hypothetical protein